MKQYLKTIKILRKKTKSLILPTLVDIVFFVGLMFVFYFFYMNMLPSMVEVADIVSSDLGEAVQSLSIEDPVPIEELTPRIRQNYVFLMKNMALMLLSFFVVCIITQPYSWWSINKIFRKMKFIDYALSFSVISAAYFAVFIILAPMTANLLYFLSRTIGVPIRPLYSWLMLILLLIISYLAITTYSLIGEKKLIKKSFRKAVSGYAVRFLVSALAVFIVGFVLVKIITFITSPIIQFLIMLLIFPFVTAAKLWMLE